MSKQSDATKKAQELNQFAGYKRFTVIRTPMPGQDGVTLNNSWSIHDGKTGENYAWGSIYGTAALAVLISKLKKQKVDAVSSASASSTKGRRELRHEDDDFGESISEDDLEHYGRIGMKWYKHIFGDDKAYRKSISKLKKLDSKSDKAQLASAKKNAASVSKYQRKEAKYEKKAAKAQVKSSKAGRKDSKLEMKARKLRMKAGKARRLSRYQRLQRKAEKLEFRSAKKEFRSSKLQLKADKYSKKAAKAAEKAVKVNASSANKSVKSIRYEQKAKDWANFMNETFHDIPISSFEPSDIAVGESYGVTFINEYMKNK